jgi:hypothetical protein
MKSLFYRSNSGFQPFIFTEITQEEKITNFYLDQDK